MLFVRVLNAIASVLTIPVVSAVLAHGAVVYAQRRKAQQAVSLRQVFALADRAWSDVLMLWDAIWKDGTSSPYIWFAAGLLALSSLQAPIKEALVSTETITIMTCMDNPLYIFSDHCGDNLGIHQVVGYDPEPYSLARAPQGVIVRDVVKKLATVSDLDMQLHLWHEPSTNTKNINLENNAFSSQLQWFYSEAAQNSTYFVSAIANNTGTGILREHAIRLNSTAECVPIDIAAFPATCPGDQPLVALYNRSGGMSIDICAPGDYTTSPWTLARERQDIQEELFVRVLARPEVNPVGSSFAVRCNANTTRGYFELGNIQNSYSASGLIDQWPTNETMFHNFNDYLSADGGYNFPSNNDTYPDDRGARWAPGTSIFGEINFDPSLDSVEPPYTPGPLMTSALAMFGNDSFFNMAANSSNNPHPLLSICQANNIPFIRVSTVGVASAVGLNEVDASVCDNLVQLNFSITDEIWYLENNFLYSWMSIFNDTSYSKEFLEIGMFLSSESLLLGTVAATFDSYSRAIFSSPGFLVTRPSVTQKGTIAISVLISSELLCLTILVGYIYAAPTWTAKFDSFAVAQLAMTTAEEDVIPPIGPFSKEVRNKLKGVDGLVGVAQDGTHDVGKESPKKAVRVISLARGGEGLVTRQRMWRPKSRLKWLRKKKSTELLLDHRNVPL
ncbi:MAG: hypothetical protein M1818_007918 [Claussenomyces sp. TS43310]|nr:MAG: hypothetical protein M1818_007918 [Claussenomyces sp. TS43310]